MKRITLLAIFSLTLVTLTLAQAPPGKGGKQLNAGLGFSSWGVPVYVGMDFGVHPDITIGPKISYRNYRSRHSGYKYSQSLTVIAFNGNYHFNTLFNLPSEWNIYAGLSLGYYLWSDVKYDGVSTGWGGRSSTVGLDLQVGARYFFTDKVGLNLEFGGGYANGGGFGITVKL